MENFLTRLKASFEKIPTKTRFLKDLGLNNCYTGFRYFMHGKKQEPSKKFMDLISDEIGYDYKLIPVKRDEDNQKLAQKLQDVFIADLDTHLKRYEKDTARFYAKNYGKESSVGSAIEAFACEEELLDPNKKIDMSDIF